ncbi:MAG: transposase [Chloroflexota bacterium]
MHLHVLKRPAVDALRHYMRQHDLQLPADLQASLLNTLLTHLMEIEVSQVLAASLYERANGRRAYRNGYRARAWTCAGQEIILRIPKLRRGSYYPTFIDEAETETVIQQFLWHAYVYGVDDAEVVDLLDTLRIDADTAQVADLGAALYDVFVDAKTTSLTTHAVKLDVIAVQERGHDRYLALAVDDDALLAHDITPDADEDFWRDFVRRLDGRSVNGIEYVAVSRVHTVVRVSETPMPAMRLVA